MNPPQKSPFGLKDPLRSVIMDVKKDVSTKRLKLSSGPAKPSEAAAKPNEAVVRKDKKRVLDTLMNAEEVDNSSSTRVKLTLAEKLEYKKKQNENFDKSLLEVHDDDLESKNSDDNGRECNVDAQEETACVVGEGSKCTVKRVIDKEVMNGICQYVIDFSTRWMDMYCFYQDSTLCSENFLLILEYLNEKHSFDGFASLKTILRVRDWIEHLTEKE